MRETNTSRVLILKCLLCSGHMAQWCEAAFPCAGGMWSAGSNPDGATVRNLNFLCSYFFFYRIFTLRFVSVYSDC